MKIITTVTGKGRPVLEGADKNWSVTRAGDRYVYTLRAAYTTAYGFGEKFDRVNQKGRVVKAAVIEKCFYQGEFTYFSMPFFMTADGFGLYVETYVEVVFDFTKADEITISLPEGSRGEVPKIYLFEGSPKEIIGHFKSVTAPTKLFPKWVLGAWLSANRWRRQNEVMQEAELAEKYGFPHSVLVIEPWSDLSTHYLWGGCKCPPKKGDAYATYEELDFSQSEYWSDPKSMVEKLHEKNLRVLLWLIPIFAKDGAIESACNVEQRLSDNEYVVRHKECVMNADGTPYEIPHTWNVGSMVPDFTNPDCREHYLNHFKHLLQIGVDGFKTDGGEFIHNEDVVFSDGTTGREGRNAYCEQYIAAFDELIGEGRALFSRAGGQFAPAHTVSWAGDQESTWPEFRSVVKAGLSAGLSGVSNWGFDIAGFSGYLPSKGLYARAVAAAAFVPIMQWHSDPVANGRCDFTGAWTINDRSPWNMAAFHKDPDYLAMLRTHFLLHYNLIPYQYNLMVEAHRTGVPAMRHLVYEFPSDPAVREIEDQFMLGDAILVAPVLGDYCDTRPVYLPAGRWYDFFTGAKTEGGRTIEVPLSDERIPVYLRDNACVALNLAGGKLCSPVGNDLGRYEELTFYLGGTGRYAFTDDLGNEIEIKWTESEVETVKNKLGTPFRVVRAGQNLLG